jgi:hypothetical protein
MTPEQGAQPKREFLNGLWKPVAFVSGMLLFMWLVMWHMSHIFDHEEDGLTPMTSKHAVEGSFMFVSPEGALQMTPVDCVSGYERNFEGVLFSFAEDSPVRELRLAYERPDAKIVFVDFADVEKSRLIREAECVLIRDQRKIRNVTHNGRYMQRLRGELEVNCPGRGFTGTVRYQGCYP